MRIACLGGGPAGLYFAISMKLRDPAHEIDLFERNRADSTFGWGVVFSDQTVENLMANDPVSGATIRDEFAHWDDIDVHIHGATIRSSGHGFIGIGRKRLLNILQERASALGVRLHFEHEGSAELEDWAGYDVVIAADGANSRIRTRYEEHFGADIQVRKNKFFWFGTQKVFDAFTFAFEKTEAGWIWAHAYRFDEDFSTFIVEMDPGTWERLGFDNMDQPEAIELCEGIFAKYLGGHRLMSNAQHLPGPQAWLNFRRVICDRWSYRNLILLGDAAHTAHFSIGSGTKLALEDSIKLAEVLNRPGLSREAALVEYQEERNVEVLKLQNSARNSTEWFETLVRYLEFEPIQLPIRCSPDRSGSAMRICAFETKDGSRAWSDGSSRSRRHSSQRCAPPMFAPYKLRDMKLENRVVVSQWRPIRPRTAPRTISISSITAPGRKGGAGLVYTEMTCVSPTGRITPGCAGMYHRTMSLPGSASSTSFIPIQQRRSASAWPFGRERLNPRRVGGL
jgi:anthraniloyl-CoA monooxygenase